MGSNHVGDSRASKTSAGTYNISVLNRNILIEKSRKTNIGGKWNLYP